VAFICARARRRIGTSEAYRCRREMKKVRGPVLEKFHKFWAQRLGRGEY